MKKKQIHVVAAIIKNADGEILCAKRSEKMFLANYWEFPGGKVEAGESKKAALIREIYEELQCEIVVLDQVEHTLYEYEAFIIQLETFWAEIKAGIPVKKEHAEIKWLPVNSLAELNWASADIPAVRKVVEQCIKEFTNN